MITSIKLIQEVYEKFLSSESMDSWDNLDDALSNLEFLNNLETVQESEILHMRHYEKGVRCRLNHSPKQCVAPRIYSAAGSIIEDYRKTGILYPKERYVLQYYLALAHTKFIISAS